MYFVGYGDNNFFVMIYQLTLQNVVFQDIMGRGTVLKLSAIVTATIERSTFSANSLDLCAMRNAVYASPTCMISNMLDCPAQEKKNKTLH